MYVSSSVIIIIIYEVFFGLYIAEVQTFEMSPVILGLLHLLKKKELKSFPPENIFVFWFKVKLQIDTLN